MMPRIEIIEMAMAYACMLMTASLAGAPELSTSPVRQVEGRLFGRRRERCFAWRIIVGIMQQRTSVSSGTTWEAVAGYARAVRVGNQVWVSGTTAADGAQLIGGDDPAAQTRFILQKIERALNQLGAQLSDVVRTRMFVSNMGNWEAVARVHGEVFGAIRPAATLVQAQLIGEQFLVEIEVDAVVAA